MSGLAAALLDALGPGCSMGFVVHGPDLRTLLITPSLAAATGAPPSAHLGRRPAETFGESGAVLEAALREVLATGRELHGPETEVGGRWWDPGLYPLDTPEGRLVAAFVLDVTERHETHKRLLQSRGRLDEAEAMAGLVSWSWDLEDGTWTWSEDLFRLAGLDPDTPPPDADALLAMVNEPSRGELRAAMAALRAGRPAEATFTYARPAGELRIFRARGVPVNGADGRATQVDGYAQDVTELKRGEARQAALALLGQLALSGLPHDALMRHAVDAVATTVRADYAVVLEAQPGDSFVLRGISGGHAPELDGNPVVLGPESLAAQTLRATETIIVADWREEARHPVPELAARHGLRASVSARIGPRGAPYGVLQAHAAGPGCIGPADVAFLETVANVLASALDRLRTEAEVAEQAAARRRLVGQALDAEDRTRRAISESLHDGPLQDLLATAHEVERLRATDERDEAHLARVRDAIGRAVRQIRETMLDLHPLVLQVGGLEPALHAVCAQQARQGGFECELEIEPAASGLRDDLVLALARELLRNVSKHARAARVDVSVRRSAEAVVLEVADDGVGIPDGWLRTAPASGHIGLASSLERVEAIGGRLRVAAAPGGGTRALAVLPA